MNRVEVHDAVPQGWGRECDVSPMATYAECRFQSVSGVPAEWPACWSTNVNGALIPTHGEDVNQDLRRQTVDGQQGVGQSIRDRSRIHQKTFEKFQLDVEYMSNRLDRLEQQMGVTCSVRL